MILHVLRALFVLLMAAIGWNFLYRGAGEGDRIPGH